MDAEAAATAIEAELCGRRFGRFMRAAWHIVEPATPFVEGWHLDVMAEHLQACGEQQIRQLLINVPPGYMKSLMGSVLFPAWLWTRVPAGRVLSVSYKEDLATRDCVKSRRILQSPWYRARWGHRFRITSDQNEKKRYDNDRSGMRVAGSLGSVTGERAHWIIVDDPHNIKDIDSALEREGTAQAWREVISQRMADPKTAVKIVIMQRLHPEDLSGQLLADGGWEHLRLPAEYDGKRCVTVLGSVDRRTKPNELLWPQRYPREVVEQQKKDLRHFGTAGQLQQEPQHREGQLFQREWFEIVGAVPTSGIMARVRYWDKAGSKKGHGAKRTAGVRMSRHEDGTFYVEDVRTGWWPAPERERAIRDVASQDAAAFGGDKFAVVILVEQEPGSGGKESAENTIRRLPGYLVEPDLPRGDKFVRATPLADAARAGCVKLVRGEWNTEFISELEAAQPGAKLLDQMDAAAAAYNRLAALQLVSGEDVTYDGEQEGGFVLE